MSNESLKCAKCGGSYEIADEEENIAGKKYVLIRCTKCDRYIIVPEAKINEAAS